MRLIGALVVGGVMSVGASVWVGAQSNRSVVEGAWVLQDLSYAKPPTVRLNKPIGLVVFTGNHYSQVILRDSGTRPEVGPEGATATVEQLRAAWGPLVAQAGTFQISGNTLTVRPSVAKGMTVMTQGSFSEQTFTLKGDTLVLVSTRNQAGPSTNPQTMRLTRAK
jgi:hypothetical protein